MQQAEIQISRTVTTALLHYAQESPDEEVCGLIGAIDQQAVTCYLIDNIADNPETRFLLDPQQQIAAMNEMRKKNESLFAIFHSHPKAPAFPSQTDIEMAAYPDALYLIISLNTKGVLELRGFKIEESSVQEVTLSLLT